MLMDQVEEAFVTILRTLSLDVIAFNVGYDFKEARYIINVMDDLTPADHEQLEVGCEIIQRRLGIRVSLT